MKILLYNKMAPVGIHFVLLMVISGSLTAQKFPDSFQFGTASSAYQFEGAWNEDGKGANMWDTFSHIPGNIKNNDTADVACDFYHKYKEDVQLLKYLGVKLFRMSISWSRILPDGTPNKINQPGIDYYLNLIKELKSNDIEPLVTLYHWDLPQHMADLGGWLNPEIADYFAAYARIAFENFGPYVKYWVTVNEPSSTCHIGYSKGTQAPGLKLIGDGVYQCAYVHLLAHAKAYRVYDEEFRATQGGQITINVVSLWFYPKTNSSIDLQAQERILEFSLGMFANPVYNGNWPQLLIDRVANRSKLEGYPFSRLPEFTQEEIILINGTYDYFAINIFTSNIAEYTPEDDIGTPSMEKDRGVLLSVDPSWSASAASWLYDDAAGARHLLNYVQKQYNPPAIIITENGWFDTGDLDDQGRITYFKGYLSNILNAILEDGINVIGYTLWSILDNFQLEQGYTEKCGLVHVDFDSPNRTRTLKSSAEWYKRVVAAREIVD